MAVTCLLPSSKSSFLKEFVHLSRFLLQQKRKVRIFVPIYIIQIKMKDNNSGPLAPDYFARCFNSQCTQTDNCLHRLAAVHDTPALTSIRIINPLCIPKDSTQCPHFQSVKKIRVAWGISHLLDEIPYKSLQPIKSHLIRYFSRGKYYRFYRKECYLTPEDQKYIQTVFRHYNITMEPVFDSYSEEYRW